MISTPEVADNDHDGLIYEGMKVINVSELKTHLSKYLRMASRGERIIVKNRNEPIP